MTDAELYLYIDHVLLGGEAVLGTRFHHRSWKTGDAWPLSKMGRLGMAVLRDHLAGKYFVAAYCPDLVDCIEFDIDAKDCWTAKLAIKKWRHDAIRVALNDAEGLLWRSSKTGGWRFRVFLDRPYPREELRERLLAHFDAWSSVPAVRLEPRWIELVAPGNACNRLPLGRGSDILDADGRPQTGVFCIDGRLRRNVPNAIARWVETVQRLPRYDLETLLARRPVPTTDRPVTSPPSKAPALVRPASPTRSAGPALDLLLEPIPAGERNERIGRVSAALYRGGFSIEMARGLMQSWLDAFDHESTMFRGPFRQHAIAYVVGPWLTDDWNRLMRKGTFEPRARPHRKVQSQQEQAEPPRRFAARVGSARFSPGGECAFSFPCSYVPTLGYVLHARLEDDPAGWQRMVLSYVTPEDHARAAAIDDLVLRKRVLLLLGCVRYAQVEHGVTELALPGRDVERYIVGNKSTSYRPILEWAQHLGALGAVTTLHNRHLHRAATYDIPWPLAPVGELEPATAREVARQRRRERAR